MATTAKSEFQPVTFPGRNSGSVTLKQFDQAGDWKRYILLLDNFRAGASHVDIALPVPFERDVVIRTTDVGLVRLVGNEREKVVGSIMGGGSTNISRNSIGAVHSAIDTIRFCNSASPASGMVILEGV